MPLHPQNILLLDNFKVELFNFVDLTHEDPYLHNFVKQYWAPELTFESS